MHNLGSRTSALLCISVAVLSLSCCSLQRGARQETGPVDDMIKQARAHVAAGEYKKALDVYSGAYDKYHHDQALPDNYVKTGDQIINAADKAYQRRDFAEAGCIYRILFESRITKKDFAESLSFDDDYLSRQLKACSKALMEIGLAKYRAWELDEAISIWKKALAFDPDDKGVKDAIDTATIQLQKLKNIK